MTLHLGEWSTWRKWHSSAADTKRTEMGMDSTATSFRTTIMENLEIHATDGFAAATAATLGLLAHLKIDHALVGAAAASVWIEEMAEDESVDVLGLLSPERMQQVPMMAANRGFKVDPEAVERTRELDLIPMVWPSDGSEVKIHVLVAMNALYSLMIRDAVDAKLGDQTVRVVRRSDYAVLLLVDDRPEAMKRLGDLVASMDDDEIEGLNAKLETIGLGSRAVRR